MFDWIDASKRDEANYEHELMAHERMNMFAEYLSWFSGELPPCRVCGEGTDEECGICSYCQYRDMHIYY